MAGILNISEVNELGAEQFIWMFGNVVECYKEAATAVAEKLPFHNVEELCKAFADHLDNLPKDEKLKVLCSHPDLAGSAILTSESTMEQKAADLTNLDAEKKARMNQLNFNYKTKFNFPFIICARENKAAVIMDQLAVRYSNTPEQEITTAINEVKKITRLRILDLVWQS